MTTVAQAISQNSQAAPGSTVRLHLQSLGLLSSPSERIVVFGPVEIPAATPSAVVRAEVVPPRLSTAAKTPARLAPLTPRTAPRIIVKVTAVSPEVTVSIGACK